MNAFIMQKMIMKLSLLDFQENTYLSFHQMEITIRFLMMKKNKPALRDFLCLRIPARAAVAFVKNKAAKAACDMSHYIDI